MLNASRSFSDPPSLLAKSAHFCIQQNHTFRTLSFSEARKPFVCCENYRVYTNNSQLGTHAPAHHDLLVFSFHTLAWNPFCNPFVFTFMHRMGDVRTPLRIVSPRTSADSASLRYSFPLFSFCYPLRSGQPSIRPSSRNPRSPMQSLRLNPILNTDSYKLTHWWQYPPDTRHIYSYLESRGGMFEETMLAMLQYIIKSNFAGQVFTLDDVEEARRVAHAHFSGHPRTFNYEGFRSLYAKHGGRLPLRIRAVKEGTVVKTHNALITIENTDPEFYWLTNWAETLLVQVWYPITVATLSRAIKQVIGKALVRTGDPSLLPFK